jgi:hypothetical protein
MSHDANVATSLNVMAVRDALDHQRYTPVAYPDPRGLVSKLGVECPPTAVRNCSRYARKIAEMSTRRQLDACGVRMQLAATSEPVATGDLQVLNLTEQAMRGDVGQHTNRLTRASGAPVFGAPSGVTGAVEGGVAAPVVPPAAPPPSVLVARAEKRLINATLADVDGNRPDLRARFQPGDFTGSPEHANTWRAIQSLASGTPPQPIDPVIIACETERLADRHGDGLPAEQLIAMSRAPVAVTDRTITTVVRAAMFHHAQQARDEVRTATHDRSRPMDEVVAATEAATAGLHRQAARLTNQQGHGERSPLQQRLEGTPHTAPQSRESSHWRIRTRAQIRP